MRKSKIYRANIGVRAIHLPKGKHKIIFEFKPLSFKIGLVVSLSATIISFLIVIFYTKKKKNG